MGITAKARSSLHLEATTSLPPPAVLGVVEAAANLVKGGGASLLTTGITNVGAQVHVENRATDRLDLSLTSGKRLVELMTMTASVDAGQNGSSYLLVTVDSYKTRQQRLLGFIPAGPKQIHGMAPYKRFLETISTKLQGDDPSAQISISQAP